MGCLGEVSRVTCLLGGGGCSGGGDKINNE